MTVKGAKKMLVKAYSEEDKDLINPQPTIPILKRFIEIFKFCGCGINKVAIHT